MMNRSIFSMMESSQQQMDFLDDPFCLSADLFAADLDTDGSILDLCPSEGLKQTTAQGSLEDLLLPDVGEGNFGEEWMENMDIRTLLEGTAIASSGQAEILVKQEPESEPRKEGMKVAAFELLKALLTGQQPVKSDSELSITLVPSSTEMEPSLPSPEAEVPNLDFSSFLNSVDSTNMKSFEDLIEIQPEISLDNGDIVEIKPQVCSDESFEQTFNEQSSVIQPEDMQVISDHTIAIYSPVSNDDIDSILSSEPASPTEYSILSTVDTSYLSDSSQTSSVKSSQVSEENFTKLKSKSKRDKAKPTPYDPELGNVKDKKMRKKLQNKNAATRYRNKKRQEKETLQEQEVRLSDRNKELREKVESLQREIQYMKELMNEINKAKKSKI